MEALLFEDVEVEHTMIVVIEIVKRRLKKHSTGTYKAYMLE